jgi:PiT family inorganic phosphate transporter
VVTRVIRFSTAVTLCAIFVIIGALVNGEAGIENIGDYAFRSGVRTGLAAFLVMFSAGLTITLMTVLAMPISTSQCVIGSIIGWGLAYGMADLSATAKFVNAWVLTPIGALIICFILCKLTDRFLTGRIQKLWLLDYLVRGGYYVAGIFSAYSLGANNVANATGIYVGGIGIMEPFWAALLGGVSIAVGVITYSKKVMFTMGARITDLSPLTGVLALLASSVAVYFYAIVGIPVSTSQALVGAIIGAGLVKGVSSVNLAMVRNIFIAWFGTPAIAGALTWGMAMIYRHWG